jgi:hypothetical protein
MQLPVNIRGLRVNDIPCSDRRYILNSSQTFSLESEKIIDDLGKKLNYKEKSPHETRRLLWACDTISDLLPLLASLSNESKSLVFDTPPKGKLRHIPLFLRYADSFAIDLYMEKPSKAQISKFFKSLNMDSSALLKNSTERGVRLVSGKEMPFTLESANEALDLLIHLFIDKPEEPNLALTSIHAEGPFARIKDIELIINSELDRDLTDIAWLPLSYEGVSDFIKNAVKAGNVTKNSVIVPIMIIDGKPLSPFDSETKAADFLKESIKDFEKSIKKLSNGIFPPLLLSRTWYLDESGDLSYENECFSLLWNTSEIAGLNASINSRLNLMTDFVLQKPSNLIGLLQQKANLEKLRSFPDIRLKYPDFHEFENLCQKGIQKYSLEYARIPEPKEIPAEETVASIPEIPAEEVVASIPEIPVKKVSDVFIEDSYGFLNELAAKDFYRDEHKKLAELSKILKQDGLTGDQENFEKFVAEVDSLLSQIENRLEGEEENLQSELKNLKKHLASFSKPTIPYTAEEIENLTFFWKDFIPLIFKKIKTLKPYDEIKRACEKTKTEFLKKISLTSNDYSEINQDIQKYWPEYVKKIIEQFEHSALIWELKINDELNKIEEFRENNFPKEKKIPASIKVDISPKPTIPQYLNLQIAKPGLINILVTQQKKEKWRSETLHKISNYIGDMIKQYLKDIMDWIMKFDNIIDNKFTEIEKMGDYSLRKIEEKQEVNQKILEETSFTKKEIETSEQNLKIFDDNFKNFRLSTQKWVEIKTNEISGHSE